MKFVIPTIFLVLLFCNLIYFYDLNPVKVNSFGWAVFFHFTWCVVPICFCVPLITYKPTFWDRLFIILAITFSIVLGIVFVLNYNHIIAHTYGFCITIISLILAITLLVFSL